MVPRRVRKHINDEADRKDKSDLTILSIMQPEFVTAIGMVAGVLTTTAFLPQVIKSWKTRKTDDISLGMYLMILTGMLLWLFYGFLLHNVPLVVFNGLSFALASLILVLKMRK